MDFTVLTPQNLLTGGDGAKTIGGKSWTMVNSASLAEAAINDGTHAGLYLRCNTVNSLLEGASENIGCVYAVSSLLDTDLEPSNWTNLVLMFMFSTPHTPNANYEKTHLGAFRGPSFSTAASIFATGNRGYDASLTGGQVYTISETSYKVLNGSTATKDVVALKIVGNTIDVFL